ncbi:2-hydroxyisoflavanone dehydratase [Bienertia sinuspersici]
MELKLNNFLLLFFLLQLVLAKATEATSKTNQSPIIIQPYIIDYRNGTVSRYITTPPSNVPPPNDQQVQSKDITIPSSSYHNLRARVFLPAQPDPARKVPILIYFHGGAFCIGTPFLWGDSHYVARVASEARVLAIAVDYRLFPEFTIPAPYDDAWAALTWVMGHASGPRPGDDPWVARYGDLNRVYVGGDSSGGNIAHNLAIRAGLGSGPRFKGLFLAMPYFLGKRRVPLEPKWITASPNYKLARLGCKKLLVYTAEVDELRGRGIWYYKKVKRSKWAGQAQWVEAHGKKHIFHISEPQDPATTKLIQDLYTSIPPSNVPPPNDQQVKSKDITFTFNSYHKLRARVFLPTQPDPAQKLPILVYFHGGAFCLEPPYYLARVAAEARVLAIAVDYRLFPEFTIPAPYDDAWATHRAQGPDKNPGNSGRPGLGPQFKGLFLAMPYFLGKKQVPLESEWILGSPNYKVWAYLCPNCKGGVDNGFTNPFGPDAPNLAHLRCKKLLVYTAEVDEFQGRGIWYYKMVKGSKWAGQAQWVEAQGKKHIFHITDPQNPATTKLIHDLSAFLNDK